MKKRNMFFIILIFCVIFSISSVAASDANDTAVSTDVENQQDQPILQSDDDSTLDGEEPIVKESTKITVKPVSGKEKNKVKVSATVKTSSNQAVKYKKVTFKINGKTYSSKTNSKGIATINIKLPAAKASKTIQKTKNNILTKTTIYKKAYTGTAKIAGDDKYAASSTKFKVTPTKKPTVKKFKVIKQKKTVTIPIKKFGVTIKTVGYYRFAVNHGCLEGHRLQIIGGDLRFKKLIKFSSNVLYKENGKMKYMCKNTLRSRTSYDIHEYYYNAHGNPTVYVKIAYTAAHYKKI